MGSVAAWVGLVGGVISIILFLGAAAVYLNGSKDKGTISTLTSNNAALEQKTSLQEKEIAELRTQVASLGGRVTALEHENETLRAERPSAERINEIANDLKKHDTDTRDLLRALVRKAGEQ